MRRLFWIVVCLWLIAFAAHGETIHNGPHDPGAARSDLSNVSGATDLTLSGKVQAAWADILGDVYASGSAIVGAGTAAAPAYTTVGDENTGIYFPAADTVGISVGGSNVAQVDSYGISDPELNSRIEAYNNMNPKRWGIKIDTTDSDPFTSVEYVFDATSFSPATFTFDGVTGEMNGHDYGDWYPFINAICRPVMVNPDGSVAYELDHSDQTKKLDGTASDITSTSHDMNAMVEFKRLWKKIYTDGTDIYIVFSNVQYDPDYEAYAFTNSSGEVNDRFYYSMFEGSNVSSKLRSLAAGTVMVSQAGSTEISYAQANGTGWYITSYQQHNFIACLGALVSKSLASQAVFGRGNSNSGAYVNPGAAVSTPMFYGYDATDTSKVVKSLYIENMWGNYWMRCGGLLYRNDSGTGKIYIKNTPTYNNTGSGYTDTGITPSGSSGGYTNQIVAANALLTPSVSSGSSTTYFGDGFWWALPSSSGDCHFALVGGYRGNAALCGSFAVTLGNPLSFVSSFVGARLSFVKE